MPTRVSSRSHVLGFAPDFLLFDHPSAFLNLFQVEQGHIPPPSQQQQQRLFEFSMRINVLKRKGTDKLVLPERDLHGAIKAGVERRGGISHIKGSVWWGQGGKLTQQRRKAGQPTHTTTCTHTRSRPALWPMTSWLWTKHPHLPL